MAANSEYTAAAVRAACGHIFKGEVDETKGKLELATYYIRNSWLVGCMTAQQVGKFADSLLVHVVCWLNWLLFARAQLLMVLWHVL